MSYDKQTVIRTCDNTEIKQRKREPNREVKTGECVREKEGVME